MSCRSRLAACLLFALSTMHVRAQTPPPILAPPLHADRPFPGWKNLNGRVVVVDFWGTWCPPCLAALQNIDALQNQFAGRPVVFLTVARDERDRVKKYFEENRLNLTTFVEDHPRTFGDWSVGGVPAAAIVLADGTLLGTTASENVTASLLESVLAGQRPSLPPFQRNANFDWDQDEIQWLDGVRPEFLVVIKPTAAATGGYIYKPGSNRASGDGTNVIALITLAWQTDITHLSLRTEIPTQQKYRFAAAVPQGREATLLPALRDAIQRTFALRIEWKEEERDVLVLRSEKALAHSSSDAVFTIMRGIINIRSQPIERLAATLPNYTGKIVVDETGLEGRYDFTISYRGDSPETLLNDLKSKYGLTLQPARRRVRVLYVEAEH